MPKPTWGKDWTVGVRVWMERHGQAILGEGRAELLDAIGRQRSITAAAKSVGMSYRRAWTLIQEINRAAREPLVAAAVGGIKGGGAQLTEQGRFAVDVFQQLQASLHDRAAGVLRGIISPDETALPSVHLAAAISLQDAVGQILAQYALHRPAVRVRTVFGASNELADHLLAGAPGDVFIAAEATEIDRLQSAGKLVPRSRRTVAFNGLAVIGPAGGGAIKKLSDLLGPKVRQIVMAEPACPLGRYTQDFLKSAGLLLKLQPKVVYVDNSRAVLSAVVSGAADAGLAFSSDAKRSGECQTLLFIPHSKTAARYVAGIVAGGKQPDESRALLNFITSPASASCYRRCGLQPAAVKSRARELQ